MSLRDQSHAQTPDEDRRRKRHRLWLPYPQPPAGPDNPTAGHLGSVSIDSVLPHSYPIVARRANDAFKEDDHPRDDDGKFSSGVHHYGHTKASGYSAEAKAKADKIADGKMQGASTPQQAKAIMDEVAKAVGYPTHKIKAVAGSPPKFNKNGKTYTTAAHCDDKTGTVMMWAQVNPPVGSLASPPTRSCMAAGPRCAAASSTRKTQAAS